MTHKSRTYLFYRSSDFLLYLLSLFIVAMGALLALPQTPVRAVFGCALLYMAATFAFKHGARFDASSFPLMARGVLDYPRRLFRLFHAHPPIALVCIFGLAVVAQEAGRRFLPPNSFWLRSFPAVTVALVAFSGASLFRTIILVAHLRRSSHVRSVLEHSPWSHELKGLSIWNHIFHGYVTGLISHACLLLPTLILWRFAPPTMLRELILLGTFLLREPRGQTDETLTAVHEEDHSSRFHFTVFHGHHHDAIPSAVMASGASGFVESLDRAVYFLSFMNSAFDCLVESFYMTRNMITHQYIPGVFPYSRNVIVSRNHHVVHHYGSLRPLGLGGVTSYRRDLESGYDSNNQKARWFVAVTKTYEQIDEEACEAFLDHAQVTVVRKSVR